MFAIPQIHVERTRCKALDVFSPSAQVAEEDKFYPNDLVAFLRNLALTCEEDDEGEIQCSFVSASSDD